MVWSTLCGQMALYAMHSQGLACCNDSGALCAGWCDCRQWLGLNYTTGKGKVNLDNSKIRPLEVCDLLCRSLLVCCVPGTCICGHDARQWQRVV